MELSFSIKKIRCDSSLIHFFVSLLPKFRLCKRCNETLYIMTTLNNMTPYLKNLDVMGWYDIFDNLFMYETLPYPVSNNCDSISEYFLMLNDAISKANDSELMKHFHEVLLLYYFDLPVSDANCPKIYTLHWVFANFKPRVAMAGKLFNQLYSEKLNNVYHGAIHLHASLLSLIHELPATFDNFDNSGIISYLHSAINRINDYSFFRVALRYFIEKKKIAEYKRFFLNISHKYDNERFANVLAGSLMDMKNYYGSFQKVYEEIDFLYNPSYRESFPSLFKMIINTLETNYLKDEFLLEGGKLAHDPFAKLNLKKIPRDEENKPKIK